MTAPPYPAKGTTDWYEPLHDYTEGIRDEADDKLAMKADTASLGTAAFASTGDFATATQGGKADSAVQPAALDGLNADRHTHANKPILDGIGALNLAPNGGLVGQVLTAGPSGRVWGDVPGVMYPALLMSPDGSSGRSGTVSPTVDINISIVAGQYGNAWSPTQSTRFITVPASTYISGNVITAIARWRAPSTLVGGYIFAQGNYNDQSFLGLLLDASGGIRVIARYNNVDVLTSPVLTTVAADSWHTISICYENRVIRVVMDGIVIGVLAATTSLLIAFGQMGFGQGVSIVGAKYESALVYPGAVPDKEVMRITGIASAWTLPSVPINTTIPNDFVPTNRIAAGGSTLCNGPGTGSDTVATLAATTLVTDTTGRQNVSGVDYARVTTSVLGSGWVPLTALTTL